MFQEYSSLSDLWSRVKMPSAGTHHHMVLGGKYVPLIWEGDGK